MNAERKLDPLTSLRFFAAAMIVAHHGVGRGLGPEWLANFALGQGVTFFFVLSGFVLAYNYSNFASRAEIYKFYWARIARIWPSHVATGFLYVALIGNISYFTLPHGWRLEITLAYLALVHAWIPVSEFITAYNTVSWSISTEFFFYLVFPLLVFQWSTTWRVKLMLTFALACLMWWLSDIFPVAPNGTEDGRGNLAYINPLARMFEFTLGIAVCNFYRQHGDRIISFLTAANATLLELGVAILVIASLWFSEYLAHDPMIISYLGKTASIVFDTTGVGTLVFCLVIFVFAIGAGEVSRALRTKPMVFLGEISFALYLVHTLFLLYRQQAPGVFATISQDWVYVLYWVCGLMLAVMVHLLVEKPGQSLIRGWSAAASWPSRSRQHAGTIGLYLLTVGAMVLLQPSTRSAYAQSDTSNRKLLDAPVSFNNGFQLDQIEVLPAQLRFSWRAHGEISLAKRVAVHLLDDAGVMTGQLDFTIETGYRTAADGENWSNLVALNGIHLLSSSALGIAVYDQHGMTAVGDSQKDATDWNGTRLIVPLRSDVIFGKKKVAQ